LSERDALRELAANRGCRLVTSRIRTPGKGDYGHYGLEDAKTGKAVLGIGARGLTATPEEVEAFLRGGTAASLKRSLGATPAKKAAPARARKAAPKPVETRVREAKPGDAGQIAALIVALGYDVTEADVRKRMAALRRGGEPVLVAVRETIAGVLSWHVTPVLHRPRPVGRITMLVVDEQARGGGIGALLVAEAEKRLRARGCGLVEVTSNRKRLRAHAFYERLGYERTSYRFGKQLGD
jgi:ribosomal protein S18 acetylase RimI-like enzyme